MDNRPRPPRVSVLVCVALGYVLAACDQAGPGPAPDREDTLVATVGAVGEESRSVERISLADPSEVVTLFTVEDVWAAHPVTRSQGLRNVSVSGDLVAFDLWEGKGSYVGVYTEPEGVRVLPVRAALSDPRISPSGRYLMVRQTGFGASIGTFLVEPGLAGPAEAEDLVCVVCNGTSPGRDGSFQIRTDFLQWGETDDELIAGAVDVNHPDFPGGPAHVYVVDVETLEPIRRLTETPLPTYPRAVMPGGGGAAYVHDRALYMVRPLDAAPRRLASSVEVTNYGWSRGGTFWYVERRLVDGGEWYEATIHVVEPSGVETALGPYAYVGDVEIL